MTETLANVKEIRHMLSKYSIIHSCEVLFLNDLFNTTQEFMELKNIYQLLITSDEQLSRMNHAELYSTRSKIHTYFNDLNDYVDTRYTLNLIKIDHDECFMFYIRLFKELRNVVTTSERMILMYNINKEMYHPDSIIYALLSIIGNSKEPLWKMIDSSNKYISLLIKSIAVKSNENLWCETYKYNDINDMMNHIKEIYTAGFPELVENMGLSRETQLVITTSLLNEKNNELEYIKKNPKEFINKLHANMTKESKLQLVNAILSTI